MDDSGIVKRCLALEFRRKLSSLPWQPASALRQLSPCDYVRFWRWAPSASGEFTVYKKGWLATLHRNPVKNLILFSHLPTQSASTNLP
jgi:hypothetical protein